MEMQYAMSAQQGNKSQLPWDDETWNEIDKAVHDECKGTKVAAKFLPIHMVTELSEYKGAIPSDTILLDRPEVDTLGARC